MAFCYNRLWKLLIDNGMNKTRLRELTGLSSSTVSTMAKNEYVAMSVLDKICDALDCNIEDIIEHIKENPAGE